MKTSLLHSPFCLDQTSERRLEAAALIQKTQAKPQNFRSATPRNRAILESSGWQQGKQRLQKVEPSSWWLKRSWKEMTSRHSCTKLFKYQKFIYPYSGINTSTGSCSTPRGVSEQHESDCLSVSHKQSLFPQAELGATDTGQLGPANSTGVLNRLHPQPQPATSTPTNSPTTGQTCTGDSGTPTERGNTGVLPIQREFCRPNILG